MEDLSLHVLDIAENSIKAGATLVTITIEEDKRQDRLTLSIEDNGSGMDSETLARVTDPFFTTRTTRRVGLGLPFLKAAATGAEGDMVITSQLGTGTKVEAVFRYSHIDRPPIGKMDETIAALIACHPDVDFYYIHRTGSVAYSLDTRKMRQVLGEVPLSSPAVVDWVRADITAGLNEIGAGSF